VGPVVGLHNLEKKFEAIADSMRFSCGLPTHENLLPQVGLIQSLGMMQGRSVRICGTHDRDTRYRCGGSPDFLLKLDFAGKQTHELLGARDVTYSEVARVIGVAIGKSGPYLQTIAGGTVETGLDADGDVFQHGGSIVGK